MVNQYKGDSHSDPSEGITLNSAIVEDGELEYKGYIFSKDSEENKKLRSEQNKRSLRTDDDGYVTDAISRRSLDRAAIPLVESHEIKRINKLMAELEAAEKQLDDAGVPNDMMSQQSPMMDPSMTGELPMMEEGGFTPKVTTNQQYDESFIDPSNMNDASTAAFSSAGTKQSAPSSMNGYLAAATGIANVAGNVTSQTLDTDLKNEQIGIMDSTADTVMSNVPVVGQFYQLGAAANEPLKDWQADATKREGADSAEATSATAISGLVDPMDGWSQNAAAYEAGIISEEEAAGNLVAQMFLPGYANQAVNRANEDNRKQMANQLLIDERTSNRGGTEMLPTQERNRYMKNGGMRKPMYSTGGNKPGEGWTPGSGSYKYNRNLVENNFVEDEDVFSMQPTMLQEDFTDVNMNRPVQSPLTTAPQDPTFSVTGDAAGPDTPMSMIGEKNKALSKYDWGNLAESVGMGLLGNAGNLAFLADQGKDYDEVNYGRYSPETVNTSSSRRAVRDAMATSKEALREAGRLDRSSLAQLGTQSAKQLADAEERIRLGNTGILNDAQLKNLEISMREQDDEARNKGVALTNYYNALNALGQNTQAAYRGYNLRMSDAEKQRLVAEQNARLEALIASMK